MQKKITSLVRAGFAGIYVVSGEEIRMEKEISEVANKLKYSLYSWSAAEGLVNPASGEIRRIEDPLEAVEVLDELPERSILILKDFHVFLDDRSQSPAPLLIRTVRERLRSARSGGKVMLILGCRKLLPPELEKEFTVIEAGLPGSKMLREIAVGIADSAGINPAPEILDEAAEAARGLTTAEAEDIIAYSVVESGQMDPVVIAREKARAIARDGILEIVETRVEDSDIGGLESLKSWLSRRRRAFSAEAERFGLPVPKGVLLTGVPGTGKSLAAKAAASILQRPLLRLDAGKIFGGLVGESEANLRKAIDIAEAVSPCILWIDELEKGLSGDHSGANTDGGTSARVFGSFISWLQEKTSPVFTVGTANDVTGLPPEILRKGRFDELFFVDLPGNGERKDIWKIHIRKRGRKPEKFDLTKLAELTEGFTGAEIEQAVIDALYERFDRGGELGMKDLTEAVGSAVPLSVTMAEKIRALREWSRNRARSASGGDAGEEKKKTKTGDRRKLAA